MFAKNGWYTGSTPFLESAWPWMGEAEAFPLQTIGRSATGSLGAALATTGATTAVVTRTTAAPKQARRTRDSARLVGFISPGDARFIGYRGVRYHSRWFLPPRVVSPRGTNGANRSP